MDLPRRPPSVGRAFFFSFVQRVGGGDPPLGPHPPDPEQTRQGGPNRLPPDALSLVSPSSKATSAAISNVQRLDSRPNSLGERWSISLKASADSSSKASRVRLGRESSRLCEGVQTPLVEVVYGVAGRLRGAPEVQGDLRGALAPAAREEDLGATHGESVPGAQRFPKALALLFRQFVRTKIGVFMDDTVTRQQKPILKMH